VTKPLRKPAPYYTQIFEQKICDSRLSAYLKSQESDIVATLSAEHLEDETALLKRRLTAAARQADGLDRRKAGGLRIVFCNHALAARAGSELWVRDVANFCSNQGHEIAVYSPTLGEVAESIARMGILVTSSATAIHDFSPDIVHVNHYRYAEPVIDGFAGTDVKIVNMIHGVLPRPGMPRPAGVDRYACVSVACKAKTFLLTPANWNDIAILPSFFDEAIFTAPDSRPREKRALLFTSKAAPSQVATMREALDAFDYRLDHYGHAGAVVADPAQMLPTYDVVFAVGRSAVEALACGCRVILWDDGVIGPSVNRETFWTCVTANFALPSKLLPFRFCDEAEAKSWIGEQLGAARELENGEVVAATRHNLTVKTVGRLLLDIYRDALSARSSQTSLADNL
jgi:hypothetical protein